MFSVSKPRHVVYTCPEAVAQVCDALRYDSEGRKALPHYDDAAERLTAYLSDIDPVSLTDPRRELWSVASTLNLPLEEDCPLPEWLAKGLHQWLVDSDHEDALAYEDARDAQRHHTPTIIFITS